MRSAGTVNLWREAVKIGIVAAGAAAAISLAKAKGFGWDWFRLLFLR